MVQPTYSNGDTGAADEQLAAHPSQLPTHPDQVAKLPAPNLVPDGVSPPIRHPLDPLNAGKGSQSVKQVVCASRDFIQMKSI